MAAATAAAATAAATTTTTTTVAAAAKVMTSTATAYTSWRLNCRGGPRLGRWWCWLRRDGAAEPEICQR
jgi:hypothetical protein